MLTGCDEMGTQFDLVCIVVSKQLLLMDVLAAVTRTVDDDRLCLVEHCIGQLLKLLLVETC